MTLTDDDLIRAMVDDLAATVAGNGFYTSVETMTPVFQKSRVQATRASGEAELNMRIVRHRT